MRRRPRSRFALVCLGAGAVLLAGGCGGGDAGDAPTDPTPASSTSIGSTAPNSPTTGSTSPDSTSPGTSPSTTTPTGPPLADGPLLALDSVTLRAPKFFRPAGDTGVTVTASTQGAGYGFVSLGAIFASGQTDLDHLAGIVLAGRATFHRLPDMVVNGHPGYVILDTSEKPVLSWEYGTLYDDQIITIRLQAGNQASLDTLIAMVTPTLTFR